MTERWKDVKESSVSEGCMAASRLISLLAAFKNARVSQRFHLWVSDKQAEPAWPGSDEQLEEKTSRPGFRSLARLTMTGVRKWS